MDELPEFSDFEVIKVTGTIDRLQMLAMQDRILPGIEAESVQRHDVGEVPAFIAKNLFAPVDWNNIAALDFRNLEHDLWMYINGLSVDFQKENRLLRTTLNELSISKLLGGENAVGIEVDMSVEIAAIAFATRVRYFLVVEDNKLRLGEVHIDRHKLFSEQVGGYDLELMVAVSNYFAMISLPLLTSETHTDQGNGNVVLGMPCTGKTTLVEFLSSSFITAADNAHHNHDLHAVDFDPKQFDGNELFSVAHLIYSIKAHIKTNVLEAVSEQRYAPSYHRRMTVANVLELFSEITGIPNVVNGGPIQALISQLAYMQLLPVDTELSAAELLSQILSGSAEIREQILQMGKQTQLSDLLKLINQHLGNPTFLKTELTDEQYAQAWESQGKADKDRRAAVLYNKEYLQIWIETILILIQEHTDSKVEMVNPFDTTTLPVIAREKIHSPQVIAEHVMKDSRLLIMMAHNRHHFTEVLQQLPVTELKLIVANIVELCAHMATNGGGKIELGSQLAFLTVEQLRGVINELTEDGLRPQHELAAFRLKTREIFNKHTDVEDLLGLARAVLEVLGKRAS